ENRWPRSHGDKVRVSRACCVERRADNRLGHGTSWQVEVPCRCPGVFTRSTSSRALYKSIGVHEYEIGISPVDQTVAAVATVDACPDGSRGGAGGAVILETGEQNIGISWMLGEEVCTQAGQPVVLTGKFAVPTWIAVQEHTAIAATPQLRRIAGRVDQHVHVCMRARAN